SGSAASAKSLAFVSPSASGSIAASRARRIEAATAAASRSNRTVWREPRNTSRSPDGTSTAESPEASAPASVVLRTRTSRVVLEHVGEVIIALTVFLLYGHAATRTSRQGEVPTHAATCLRGRSRDQVRDAETCVSRP